MDEPTKTAQEILAQALAFIQEDRAAINAHLENIEQLGNNVYALKEESTILAKCLQGMQNTTAQMLRLAEVAHKIEKGSSEELDEIDENDSESEMPEFMQTIRKNKQDLPGKTKMEN
jgi:hypothetical protein